MSKAKKTLDRVLRGDADASIRFGDLCALLHDLGFTERVRGAHHIFAHEGIAEILNLQPRSGKAKPYQVKQVRNLITAHRLADPLESDETVAEPSSENDDEPREE